MIEDMLQENTVLDELELETVLKKLTDVINVSVITQQLGEVIINITSDILESESDLHPFTNRCALHNNIYELSCDIYLICFITNGLSMLH